MPNGAIPYLERAAAAEPEAAPIWFNLFQAFDMAGDAERGMASLDRALSADPYYVPAILMKAELLDRLGRAPEVAGAVSRDPRRQPQCRQPARAGAPGARARARAGPGRRRAACRRSGGPARRRPCRLSRSGLPSRRGLCRAADRPPQGLCRSSRSTAISPICRRSNSFRATIFPWLAALEAKTAEIRQELVSLLEERDRGFRPYIAFDPTQPVNQWAELNHSPRWSAWFFWEDGARHAEHCARCPATAALLDALPLLDLPGKGPTAMFSILEPHTRIPPHTGSNNVRTTVHLPLVVPEGCGFRVGAETRTFEAGKAWAFDDTIEHEAWNDSDAPRAIFILDVWNPLLSEAERAAVRVVG